MTDARSRQLGPADRDRLRAHGLPEEEVLRQVALLRRRRRYARLERPCSPGDGLERIAARDEDRLVRLASAAAGAGRILKFVPASGAATRMFHDLMAARAEDDSAERRPAVAAFLDALPRLAFEPDLRAALQRRGADLDELREAGRWRPILDALLEDGGMGCGRLPKALLAFHAYEDGARTALEEHLVEAAALARDASGACRVHFSVAPDQRRAFEEFARRAVPRWEARLACRFEIGLSVQSPATDAIALDDNGDLFRDERGALLLRPSGHGALIDNLAAVGADLVIVKNVDNVAPDRLKEETYRWSRLLLGRALEVQERVAGMLRRLDDPADAAAPREGVALAERVFGRSPQPDAARDPRESARRLLERPLRVCGMVPNSGEPGGGPFWTATPGGAPERQIVEAAEVDSSDPVQRAIHASATHFNPVFMACALRDHDGRPFDLAAYGDPDAVIVSVKTSGGRRLLALERPGLWNGAMARWNTIFVEVPPAVFNPVKSVGDLLRPEHQPD